MNSTPDFESDVNLDWSRLQKAIDQVASSCSNPEEGLSMRTIAEEYFLDGREILDEVNPLIFALNVEEVAAALISKETGEECCRNTFRKAFFGSQAALWFMGSWRGTWMVLGDENLYPRLTFSPTQTYCEYEDLQISGNVSTSCRSEVGSNSVSFLPTTAGTGFTKVTDRVRIYNFSTVGGSQVSVRLREIIGNDMSEAFIDYSIRPGFRRIRGNVDTAPKEQSAAMLLLPALQEEFKGFQFCKVNLKKNSVIDVSLVFENGDLDIQHTTLELEELLMALGNGNALDAEYRLDNFTKAAENAIAKKEKKRQSQAWETKKVALLLDAGLTVPPMEGLEQFIKCYCSPFAHEWKSIWLVYRVVRKIVRIA